MNHEIKLEQLDTLLKNANADYSILKNETNISSAAQGAALYGISLSETTPTLIIKTDSGYLAAIIGGDTRISFKKLKHALNSKDVNLADPETVFNITGAKIGEVSLVNPELKTIIDSNVLKNKACYGGCGTPKTTLRINTNDLIKITNAQILDFADVRS
ncbi:MAG: YbaK/EbsC family protein [Candidatus Babeliales bacterium]|nr:YbaK/EbsC family protein [Candidatus Babeliales bacterium]